MRAFFAFVKAGAGQQLDNRGELVAIAFGLLVDVYGRISVWKAVYAGETAVSGVTLPQMVAYAVFGATILHSWDAALLVRAMGEAHRSGRIGASLLRPFSYPLALFCEQLGPRLLQFLLAGGPVILLCALLFGFPPPASLGHALLFPFFVAVSSVILLEIGILTGLLSVWVLDVHSLEWFMRGFVMLLSGGLVPLWFFPSEVETIARALPFAFIAFHPMAAYLGRADLPGSALLLLEGAAWAAGLAAIIAFAWSRACRQAVIHGG